MKVLIYYLFIVNFYRWIGHGCTMQTWWTHISMEILINSLKSQRTTPERRTQCWYIALAEFMEIWKYLASQLHVDAKRSHTKPESPVRQARTALDSNQDVPVNLTCKLTRKQQTVKFKTVLVGFPNHPYAAYRHGSADTENGNRSSIKGVY